MTFLSKTKKSIALFLMFICLLIQPALANDYTDITAYSPMAGVWVRMTQQITNGEIFRYQVVEADLSNPNLKLELMYPANGASALAPTKEIGTQNNAAVAMNADYFNRSSETKKGSAVGYNAKNGMLLSNALEEKVYSFSYNANHEYSFDIFSNQIKIGFNDSVFEFVKTYNKYSSLEGIALYDRHWGEESLGSEGTLVELVIEDDILKEIRKDMPPVKIPENGYVIAGLSDLTTLFDQIQVGDKVSLEIITTPNLDFLADFTVGGGSLLVDKGEIVSKMSYPIGSTSAFPALGISKDGKTVWFITVVNQPGITQKKMAELCLKEGAYYAMNFDGGGSTQCVVKNNATGALEYIHELSGNYERPVANAIGVLASAKKPQPYGIYMEDILAYQNIPKKISLTVFDENGNPISLSENEIELSLKGQNGTVENGFFYGDSLGQETLVARYQNLYKECTVTIVSPAEYAVKTKQDTYRVTNGDGYVREVSREEFSLSRSVTLKDTLPVTDAMAQTATLPHTLSLYGGSRMYNNFFYRSLTGAVLKKLNRSVYPFASEQIENPMIEMVMLDNSDGSILKSDMTEWNRLTKVLNTEKQNIILLLKQPYNFKQSKEEELFSKLLSQAQQNGKNILVLYRDETTKLISLKDGVRILSLAYDASGIDSFLNTATNYLKIHYSDTQMTYEIASEQLFR